MATSAVGFAATLIGVLIAFKLDRRAQRESRRGTVKLHLEAISNELDANKETIDRNFQVVNFLQGEGNGADHYTLEPYSAGAWEAAVSDQLIEHIDGELYNDLQELYREIGNVNELIKRLRTESIHPEVDDDETDTAYGMDWTITVAYWHSSHEEVRKTGLGDLIKNRSNRVNILIDGVENDLDDAIEEMERNSEEDEDEEQSVVDYSLIPLNGILPRSD